MQVTCGVSLPASPWHSPPGDIHVSLGGAETRKIVEMPDLQSHSNEPTEVQQQPSAAAAAAAAGLCVLESCMLEKFIP